jgi:hypothetical protein
LAEVIAVQIDGKIEFQVVTDRQKASLDLVHLVSPRCYCTAIMAGSHSSRWVFG